MQSNAADARSHRGERVGVSLMKKNVVVYKKIPDSILAELRNKFNVTYFESINDSNRDQFNEALKTAHGLLGASLKFDRKALEPAARLEVVATISVGYDTFDIDYLTQRGVVLANTPTVLTETVADTVFALILGTARRIVELAEFVKAGHWKKSIGEPLYGLDVHSKTLGLLGMGRIGRAVARRARLGFNMDVTYYDLRPAPDVEASFNARRATMDEVLQSSDFVCVLLPLTPATDKIIGPREFSLMRKSAIFINGSRGRVVDEAALIDALQAGLIHGAGLDVFEREPLPTDSPLLSMPNVLALPHIGSATHDTRLGMVKGAVENLIEGLSGRRPPHVVNESVLSLHKG
jgi:lactate dehydrogenase-like 2-hydroxyacid dehydrogenase